LIFIDQFKTEKSCRNYLKKLKWPKGFICPKCGHNKAWKRNKGLFLCKKCRFETSLIVDTIFQDTKKPLRYWFIMIWYICSQKYGTNALGLKRELNFGSYRTAWSWLYKIRKLMILNNRKMLSGVIEIDETYIGSPKSGKRGRGAENKAIVLVAVEDKTENNYKNIGRIRLKYISDASSHSLLEFIENNVTAGSIIKTDKWKGYNTSKINNAYKHIQVESYELKIVHMVISLLKRWILGTYQGSIQYKYLPYYLDEYVFRFNRRFSKTRGKLFYCLIHQAVKSSPIINKNIN
jgi:transposase-like protein/predicted RNA-binding Zn-ribbon protein involved in translation (DUF1610 family)